MINPICKSIADRDEIPENRLLFNLEYLPVEKRIRYPFDKVTKAENCSIEFIVRRDLTNLLLPLKVSSCGEFGSMFLVLRLISFSAVLSILYVARTEENKTSPTFLDGPC